MHQLVYSAWWMAVQRARRPIRPSVLSASMAIVCNRMILYVWRTSNTVMVHATTCAMGPASSVVSQIVTSVLVTLPIYSTVRNVSIAIR